MAISNFSTTEVFGIWSAVSSIDVFFSNSNTNGPAYGFLGRASGTTAGRFDMMLTNTTSNDALGRAYTVGAGLFETSNVFAASANGYILGVQRVNTAAPNVRYTIQKVTSGLSGTLVTLAESTLANGPGGTVSCGAAWIMDTAVAGGAQLLLYGNGALILNVRDMVSAATQVVAQGPIVVGDNVALLAVSAHIATLIFSTLSAAS